MNMSESGQMKVNDNASHDRKMITGLDPEKVECGKRICMSQFKVVGWDFLELKKGKTRVAVQKLFQAHHMGTFTMIQTNDILSIEWVRVKAS